jgi:aromatic-L-amino-acid/L-tryptophan decarboxylase
MRGQTVTEETLDPQDWEALRRTAHRIVDDAIDYTASLRERPLWQAMPADVREGFRSGLPRGPTPLDAVYDTLTTQMMPYPMGNIHPCFWMWFMGASNVTGALGDFLAAILGSNVAGGDHAATAIDRQVVDWLKQMLRYPESASGTLVSGGSVANLICLTVARNRMAGIDVRAMGVAAMAAPLRFYGSDQLHSCHQKALETLGLGNNALRRIATHPDCTIDIAALRSALAEDRRQGRHPACVIATAGTTNTGAIDDLPALAALCREEGLWMHVDGCIGALAAIAPRHGARLQGLELADSVALDPHKWLHAPFEVGCALVRDASAHLGTFTATPEYLVAATRGISAGEWLCDYGLQTTRGFRALKVWMSIKEQGAEKFGRLIDQNIDQAHRLGVLITATARLELVAPVVLNIVCFRFNPGGLAQEDLKRLNIDIMLLLQSEGIAAVSDTTVRGVHCLRAAIANHRSTWDDLEMLVREVCRLGNLARQTATSATQASAHPRGDVHGASLAK